ncbi:hypothetical protein Prudu_94S000100, partial [Prunus dulcis]
RPLALQTVPPATTLRADLRDRSQMNHDTTANNPRPSAAAAVAGPTVRPNATRTSSSDFSSVSPPNRSSKAPGARQDCKRDIRRVKAVKVHGIHHRANYSFRTKGIIETLTAKVED